MIRAVALPLLAGAAFVVYQIITLIIHYRRQAAIAREWGTKRAPVLFKNDILGIRNVREMLEADKAKCMAEFQIQRYEELCRREGKIVNTFEIIMPPGKIHFVTLEPENLKAILATQFKDFGLPDIRIKDFTPMLGRGIVSIDFLSDPERC